MAKKSTRKQATAPVKNSPNVRVKRAGEVLLTLQNFIVFNLYGRYNLSFSKQTQKRLVSYGPWLAGLVILIVIPELLALAKTGSLITFTGFFDTIFFSQSSWVILLVIFTNIILLVDGLSDIFSKAHRGWSRIYLATLIAGIYIFWQLLGSIAQPAAPLLSLIGIIFILFTLFDIQKYYQA